MQNKRLLSLLVFWVVVMGCVSGQSPSLFTQNSNLKLHEIVTRTQPYLDSLRVANNGVMTHTEKVFARWASFWARRMDQDTVASPNGFAGALGYYSSILNGDFAICDQGSSAWRSLGPEIDVIHGVEYPSVGIVNALAWHPTDINTIYAGCNTSGVWKTTDFGTTWVNKTEYLRLPVMAVQSLAFDPTNPNTIFAGTGETAHDGIRFGLGLFKSIDGGDHWTHVWPGTLAAPTGSFDVNVIRMHPNYGVNPHIVMAGGKRIMRSTDGGTSWNEVYNSDSQIGFPDGQSFCDLEYLPGNPNVMMASTRHTVVSDAGGPPNALMGQLVVSLNGGATWQCLNDASIAPVWQHAARYGIAPSESEGALCVVYQGWGGSDWNALTFVKTWDGVNFKITKIVPSTPDFGYFKGEVVISPCDTNGIYVGGGRMHKYLTSSNSFSNNVEVHQDMRAMEVRCTSSTSADLLLIGTDGGPIYSPDGAHQFVSLNGVGLITTQFRGFDFYPGSGKIVTGAQDNGVSSLENGAWTYRLSGDGSWIEIDDHNPEYALGGTLPVWFQSMDQFTTTQFWDPQAPYRYLPDQGDANGSYFLDRRIFSDPVRPHIFWTGDERFLRSIDASMPNPTWAAPIFQKPVADLHHLQDIGFSIANPDVIYLAYDQPFWGGTPSQAFWISQDGGATFTDISTRLVDVGLNDQIYRWKYVTDIEVDPEDAGHLFIGVSGYGWNSQTQQVYGRVYESRDYGQTWRPMSQGLSPMPVNYLCYQNGTNDVLYAATDGGVFRYNRSTDTWECFNNSLPATICTRVMIDYCRNRLLVSTYGRGMWEADLPATGDYHVTSNRTWATGTVRAFPGNVIVDSGVTLTVKGTVQFAPGKRLVVAQGAKLRVLGGTLTSPCGLWGGVDVAGNVTRNQFISTNGYAPFQGIVEVINGTIEHARQGISTSLHDNSGNLYWNSFGGIVKCQGARFLNNVRDVEMLSYPRTNMSYFRNCLFETNAALHEQAGPSTHVALWNVRNIPFEGCNFRHGAGTGYSDQQCGMGIAAYDATYTVDWRCTTSTTNGCTAGTPTRFEGLQYGIHHECSNPLLSPAIKHSIFIQNKYMGAKLRGAHFAVIEDNNFDVGPAKKATGLYLENCSKYRLQSNNFFTTTPNSLARYGLIVHAGGDDYNFVYNNTFSNLPYGISAQEDNEGPLSIDGLIMNCNDFTSCTYGIMALGNSLTAGVGESQGFAAGVGQATTLVRNRYFGLCSAANENKFLVSHPNQYSIDHTCNLNSECRPTPQPACSDAVLVVSPRPILLNRTQDCQRIVATGLSTINPKINLATNRLTQKQALLNAAIDGGNTLARLLMIQQTQQPGQIQNGLMPFAPFLSDTVLIAMMNKTPMLPAGTIRAILLANSPLRPKAMQKFQALSLPQGVKNQILAAQTGTSVRQILENEVAVSRNEMTFWQDEKVRYFLRDSLFAGAADSIVVALSRYGYNACYQKQALALEGSLTDADSALGGVQFCTVGQGPFELLSIQLRAMATQCCMVDEGLGLTQHEVGLCPLPSIYPQAQAALDQLWAWRSEETQLEPPVPVAKWMDEETEGAGSGTFENFKLYPNPSQDVFFIEFEGADAAKYQIRAYDIAGRVVAEQALRPGQVNKIKLGRQTPGLYFYQILKDGQAWKTGKIQLI